MDACIICIIGVSTITIIMWTFLQSKIQRKYYRKKH